MTLSRQILAGLALGIFTGLFFGERAAALRWVADGFVKLLQMMVLPYITVSIVASLGSLQPSELRTLGLRAAGVIGGLWIVALSFAFLIPLTFPSAQNASFFSTAWSSGGTPSTSSTFIFRRTHSTHWPTTSCRPWSCSP